MWTRGKDRELAGCFAYELWDGFNLVERKGGHSTAQDADRAAEQAQRDFLFPPVQAPISEDLDAFFDNLSDDDLLLLLGA